MPREQVCICGALTDPAPRSSPIIHRTLGNIRVLKVVQYLWYFINLAPDQRVLAIKYLHVKLFGQNNIPCDTAVCNDILINECAIERWERWQNGAAHGKWEERRERARDAAAVSGTGAQMQQRNMSSPSRAGRVVYSSSELGQVLPLSALPNFSKIILTLNDKTLEMKNSSFSGLSILERLPWSSKDFLCYGWRLCWCLWSVLLPESMLMFVGHVASGGHAGVHDLCC